MNINKYNNNIYINRFVGESKDIILFYNDFLKQCEDLPLEQYNQPQLLQHLITLSTCHSQLHLQPTIAPQHTLHTISLLQLT